MKLSLALAFAAFFCSCSFPAPTHAFLLTNLASRGLKHPTPPQQKGLYSRVEYDAREPRLDEFGLPLDPSDFVEKPSVPLKVRERMGRNLVDGGKLCLMSVYVGMCVHGRWLVGECAAGLMYTWIS